MKAFNNQSRYWSILLLFLASAGALGQSLPNLKGVRITSSSVDLATGQREFTFINDSSADITAYQVTSINVHPDGSISRSTTPRDLLSPEWQTQRRHRPFLPEVSPAGGPVHPGESVTVKWFETGGSTPSTAYSSVSIGVDVAIYSDGTAESFDAAEIALFVRGRQQTAAEYASIAQIGRKVLAESNETDALVRMRDSLAAADPSSSLKSLRAREFSRVLHPQSDEEFQGSLIEYIAREQRAQCDASQRGILKVFISDQEEIAAAWNKSAQIKVHHTDEKTE